jgi:hypothetical protein
LTSEKYTNERLDHLGIVAGVCQEIGLAAWLDAQDQAHHEFPPPGIDLTHPRILPLHLLQGALHTTQYTTRLHCSYIFWAIAIKEIPNGILTFDSTRFKMGTMVSKRET